MPAPLLPAYLLPLLELFAAHGECAYPVGGCVRDTLLGNEPDDWDIAVTTPPEITQQLGEAAGYRIIPTGLRHGTVTVLLPASGDPADHTGKRFLVECTTCRTEDGYTDGRHPDAVAFTARIEDDLSRRDFTVNAMAFARGEDGALSVIDLFGGRDDLAAGVIRCVGDPETRFTEDALRMLRAVRFAVRLGFNLDPDTAAAIRALADTLSRISRERISLEFHKILLSPAPSRGLSLLADTGLLPVILPAGMQPPPRALEELPPNFPLRLSALLYGLPADAVAENLRGLRLPTVTQKTVQCLATIHLLPAIPTPAAARRLRSELDRHASDAVLVRLFHTPEHASDTRKALEQLHTLIGRSEEAREPVTLAELAVSGRDLLAIGIPPGPGLRDTLSALLDRVLDDPAQNTPTALLAEARRLRP